MNHIRLQPIHPSLHNQISQCRLLTPGQTDAGSRTIGTSPGAVTVHTPTSPKRMQIVGNDT
eukprot:UN00535